MFTGGEAVPYQRAAEFEEATGAAVLQFYGSNETGALSCTTSTDDRDHRLRTAGRVIPEMQVRLFDPRPVPTSPAVAGPGSRRARGRSPASATGPTPDANARTLHRRRLDADG